MEDFSPPIQNLEAIDVVGRRRDGGTDLFIACTGALDDSPDTLGRVKSKVMGYLLTAANYSGGIDQSATQAVRVVIVCQYSISALAEGMINSLARIAKGQGVELITVQNVEDAI